MMERLTRRTKLGAAEPYIRLSSKSENEEWLRDVVNKLAEYEDLEEQYGLPKFHIGQVVYSINFMNEIEEEKVSMITQKADRSFKYRLSSEGSVWEATEEKAGRLFFLTREETEAKLKELESE